MKDLTKGYPAKVIMMFAIPLMFGYIFQQFYNMADSKIVSTYVGTDALAAVGATAVVFNTMIFFVNGLTQGFSILIANSFGAKDMVQVSNASGGKVSVEDLSIERRVTGWYINSENIVGLPSVIASSLNYADSTDKYYDYKQMIHSILKYKQEHGEIPQYHMNFKWSGKELKC